MNILSELIHTQTVPPKPVFADAADALKVLKALGLPDTKHEEYKYAPLRKLLNEPMTGSFESRKIPESLLNQSCLVFTNGIFDAEASDLPPGIQVEAYHQPDALGFDKTAAGLYQEDAMYHAARALAGTGYSIVVKKGAHVLKPVYIISRYRGTASDVSPIAVPRCIIWEEGSSCVFQEWQLAEHCMLASVLTRCYVEKDAKAQVDLFEDLSESTRVFNYLFVLQKSLMPAQFNTICCGNGYSRNNAYLNLGVQHAEIHLHGLSLVSGSGWTDHHTTIDHCLPHGQSRQLYKSIVNDRGNYVFNGKIFVRKDAQKTNAYQSSKNLLLSADAQANAKPQLEIYADDVRCSHGSSTGHLSEDALFYLRARGIGEQSAKKILLQAYASEITDLLHEGVFKELVAGITGQAINA